MSSTRHPDHTSTEHMKSFARERARLAYQSAASNDGSSHAQPSRETPRALTSGTARRAAFAIGAQTPQTWCACRRRRARMSVEVPDSFLDALADRLAPRLAERLGVSAGSDASPWMTFEEAVQYTKVPAGTFRKLSADGTLTAHA